MDTVRWLWDFRGALMDWYRLDIGFLRHPKTHALRAALKDPRAHDYLLNLMAWAAAVEDDRGYFQAADIVESEALWRGKPGLLVQAMLKTGWLDKAADGFLLHGWEERNGAEIRRGVRKRDAKRAERHRSNPGNGPETARDIPGTVPPTRRDVTRRDEQDEQVYLEESPEPGKPGSEPALRTVEGTPYRIPEKAWEAWLASYPAVSVADECRKAHAWEMANPKRRKVDKLRFLNSWLARAQDAPSKNGHTRQDPMAGVDPAKWGRS